MDYCIHAPFSGKDAEKSSWRLENICHRRIGYPNLIRRQFQGNAKLGSGKAEENRRFEEQLNVLDFAEAFWQTWFLGIFLFSSGNLLHEGTLPIAMEEGFVFIDTLGKIFGPIPLVMQGPGSSDRGLPENTNHQ